MSKHILFGIALALLLLSGCVSNPGVQLVELSKNTVVYDEIVRINNCGGKGDSEQTKSRDFATTVEFGAGVSAGYQSIVQGSLSAKYSEYRNTSVSQRLVAPPGTNMEFVLRWSDDVRAGNVQVNGKSGTYEVRIPVSVEQVSSRDLGCGISASVQPTTPSVQSSPQSSPSSSVTYTFRVYANLSWQSTGIQIRSGDRVRIIWDGKSKWRGTNSGDFSDPLGGWIDNTNPQYACPPLMSPDVAGWNALVAKIGDNGRVVNPFKETPQGEGELKLAMNDCDSQRFDNEGSVVVIIEVTRYR
jgi:hypothetical protein